MNTKVLVAALFLAAMAFVGCKSKQAVVTPQDKGMKEIQLPCEGFDHDTEEYFTGMGTAENTNMQNARSASFDAAKSMLMKRLGGFVVGLATDYSRTMSGSAQQDKIQRAMEGEMNTVVQKMLNDSEKTCEKLYETQSGTYQSHTAIRVSKKEMIDKMSTALSDSEELEIEFNRAQFRKFAEDRMAKIKSGQY